MTGLKAYIVVPWIQPSLNVLLRRHWSKLRGGDGEQRVADLMLRSVLSKMPSKPCFKGKKVRIVYTIYFGNQQRHDYSNYGQKMLDDSLVKEGIIDDDNSEVIVEETLKIRYDKQRPRTDIYIEEIREEE